MTRDVPLASMKLRDFVPRTAGKSGVAAKVELRNEFQKQIEPKLLEGHKQECKSKDKFSIEIVYHLAENEQGTGITKDLDNLLDILFDVLQDHMDSGMQNEGLGLMERDSSIFRVVCEKKVAKSEHDCGLDLGIYEYADSHTPAKIGSNGG